MILLNQLLSILWIVFILYWIVSAIKAKKTVKNSSWWRSAAIRITIIIAAILLFQIQTFQQFAIHYDSASNVLVGSIGVFFCALGLAFAVWARVHLGTNWGMPMSLKENPELVTTGPYAFVRHPIYTGILFAIFGSLLVDGPWWFFFFLFFAVYFFYSAKTEEKIMTKQFPNEYPDYKKKTKMLIPYIL